MNKILLYRYDLDIIGDGLVNQKNNPDKSFVFDVSINNIVLIVCVVDPDVDSQSGSGDGDDAGSGEGSGDDEDSYNNEHLPKVDNNRRPTDDIYFTQSTPRPPWPVNE